MPKCCDIINNQPKESLLNCKYCCLYKKSSPFFSLYSIHIIILIMSSQEKPNMDKPGDGIRSMRSTTAFRVVNFELYAKPNIVIMSLGLACFGLTVGYIAYMRTKYEGLGYYAAVDKDGKEIFEKKKSKWD